MASTKLNTRMEQIVENALIYFSTQYSARMSIKCDHIKIINRWMSLYLGMKIKEVGRHIVHEDGHVDSWTDCEICCITDKEKFTLSKLYFGWS